MSSLVLAKAAIGDSCDLTQYTIVKGGTSCVFGTCQGATDWSALVADLLLTNLIISARYSSVIAINFDRQDLSNAVGSLVASWNKHRPLQVTSTDKLTVIDGRPALFQGTEDHESQLDKLIQEITLAIAKPAESESNNLTGNRNSAVVLYSVSELILNMGFRATRDLLRRLTVALQEAGSRSMDIKGDVVPTAVTPCIILVVHESLHSAAVLAQIQSLASVVVRVVPNNGTLSDTVACEVQTVRRSATTGKISESVEMFSCRDALLCPLKPVTAYGAEDAEDSTDSASLSKTTPTSLPAPADSTSSTTGAAGSDKAAALAAGSGNGNAKGQAQQQQSQQGHHMQRLITFDSTDPEFDEDSDPDADLDL